MPDTWLYYLVCELVLFAVFALIFVLLAVSSHRRYDDDDDDFDHIV